MSSSLLAPASLPPEPVRRFSVQEYHAMIRGGVLGEDDPYELLEGWLVPKMPRNPPHDLAVQRLQRAFQRLLPEPWLCFVQSAMTTTDSEPEPDIALVLGPDEKFKSRHPQWSEIGLIVEVSDSSLARDRSAKARLYSRAGIPTYWIVNLRANTFEIHTNPTFDESGEPCYQRRTNLGLGETADVVLHEQVIARITVQEILG